MIPKSILYLFICIFIIIIIALLLYYLDTNIDFKENFEDNSIKDNSFNDDNESKNPLLSEIFKERLKELKGISSLTYKPYFSEITVKSAKECLKNNKIFVSIPSYRDNQCSDTLRNIIENADHPENLHIVICQQNSMFDEDCLSYCMSLTKNICKKVPGINIDRIHYIQAKGPNYARWRIQQKYNGEEYYLQIDSHTRLVEHWDTILKKQLDLCPTEKAILSQYPNEFDNIAKKDRGDYLKENWKVDRLRGGLYIKEFGKEGFTRIQSNYTDQVGRSPFPGCGIASGFLFSRGQFIIDVPLDPFLYLFFGEQMDHMIRAWCAGYDMFSPTILVAFHIYKRDHRKTFWELTNQKPLEILSRFRLYYKLGKISRKDIPKEYQFILIGLLGAKSSNLKWKIKNIGPRTIEEFEKFAGIDIKDEKLLN